MFQEFPFPLSMTMIHILSNFFVVWLCRKAYVLWYKELRPVLTWKLYVEHVVPVGRSARSPSAVLTLSHLISHIQRFRHWSLQLELDFHKCFIVSTSLLLLKVTVCTFSSFTTIEWQ